MFKLASTLFDPVSQARKCAAEGDVARAAKLFERGKDFRRATRYHAEAGHERKAIETAVKAVLGPKAKAEPDADLKYAAELLVSVGGRKEAVPLLELAGEYEEAAKSAAKSGQKLRAAQLFDRARCWPRAAAYYERVGKLREAVRALDHEQRRLQALPASSPEVRRDLERVQRQRRGLVTQLGDPVAATQAVGTAPSNGRLLERSGDFQKAMEAYCESRDFEQALRLVREQPSLEDRLQGDILKQAGRPKQAAQIYGALGFALEAATAWEDAKEWQQAAQQWKKCHQLAKAGEAYSKAGQLTLAAGCFEEADLPEKAIAAFGKSGDHVKVAECQLRLGRTVEAAASYLQARKYLPAARLLLDAGKKVEAVDVLRQTPATDASFDRANLLATEILFEAGKLEDALHRVMLLNADIEAAGEVGLERLYWEARIREAMHKETEARLSYERLVSMAPGHRDAAHRLDDLQQRIRTHSAATLAGSVVGTVAGTVAGTEAATVASGMPTAGPATTEVTGPTVAALPPGAKPPAESVTVGEGCLLADRYELREELGRGGMGRVYKAYDRVLKELVAIKTLLQQMGLQSPEEARLLREVQICRKLAHPNIVRVYDIRRFQGGVFIIMELLNGKSLDHLLVRDQTLKLAQVKGIVAQVAAGLEEAHAHGIVHRDLKPGNLVLADKRIKILDFGIARLAGAETQLTQAGHILGSPHYMSPEQLQGQALDGRSDIYSLGIVTFRLLTGREPFSGESVGELLLAQLQQEPPDIHTLRPGLPEVWGTLLNRMLAKSPEARFQDISELQATLAQLPVDVRVAAS